jgi:uncharacterized protein
MIINQTRGFTIANSFLRCRSAWSKARGLMFRQPQALLMEFSKPQKVSLHMAFVFFSIDVAFLDSKWRVVELKREFRPFGFYRPKARASFILEVPAGWLKTTQKGDLIRAQA